MSSNLTAVVPLYSEELPSPSTIPKCTSDLRGWKRWQRVLFLFRTSEPPFHFIHITLALYSFVVVTSILSTSTNDSRNSCRSSRVSYSAPVYDLTVSGSFGQSSIGQCQQGSHLQVQLAKQQPSRNGIAKPELSWKIVTISLECSKSRLRLDWNSPLELSSFMHWVKWYPICEERFFVPPKRIQWLSLGIERTVK